MVERQKLCREEEHIPDKQLKTTDMARNIIDLICNSCSCGKEEAQEYLDDEIRNLQELQEDNDLRSEDFEIACSNLGLDLDWQIYFINRLVGL